MLCASLCRMWNYFRNVAQAPTNICPMEFQFQVVFCIITNAGGEGVPSCIILILFCIERERMFLVTDICGNRCTDHASKTIKETLSNNNWVFSFTWQGRDAECVQQKPFCRITINNAKKVCPCPTYNLSRS